MSDEVMPVYIARELTVFVTIEFLARIVFRGALLCCKEDVVVVNARAQPPPAFPVPSSHFCTNSTLVFVPVCGLKVLPCKPTTARMRQRSAMYSRMRLSDDLLNLPCGKTTAMRPPGFRKSRLRSMNRISRPTLSSYLPFASCSMSYLLLT